MKKKYMQVYFPSIISSGESIYIIATINSIIIKVLFFLVINVIILTLMQLNKTEGRNQNPLLYVPNIIDTPPFEL